MRHLRGKRAKAGPTVLTQRDMDMLVLIGVCRYVSTTQISREFFPSVDRCRRRLRQLYDAGYLHVTLAGSTSPNLVSLTSTGLRLVHESFPELSHRVDLPGSIRLSGVAHHLAVVDTRLYLVALAKQTNTPLLRWSNNGGDIGKEIGLDGLSLEPDGLAEMQTGSDREGVLYIAIEIDCGTESETVIGNKLRKYQQAFAGGMIDELWFVTTTGKERQKTIAAQAAAKGLSGNTRLMQITDVQARPVKEPAKRQAILNQARQEPEYGE